MDDLKMVFNKKWTRWQFRFLANKNYPNPMNKLLLILVICFPLTLMTQSDPCKLQIGTNLAGPTDYGSEWPFVNIMKYARTWITYNSSWIENGNNAWDTQLLDSIPCDEQGYPLQLPYPVQGAETTQAAKTVWANTQALPQGVYVVLWDGSGQIEVGFDATNAIQTSPNRMEFFLNAGNNNIFYLAITQSQLGDHVRNIRVLLPGTESSHATQPWDSLWYEKLEPFTSLRFMDWGYTNNSEIQQWDQRTKVDDYTYTQKTGVPYEYWISLCNKKNADAWVCIPHQADSNFIVQLATLFRDSLNPGNKIYVEYSNELWNWMFAQAQYGLTINTELSWPERLGPRIAWVMDIWNSVFAADSNRLIGVLGCQHAWFDIGNRIYQQIESMGKSHLIKAISPAAYMGLASDSLAMLDNSATGQTILNIAQNCSFNSEMYWMQGWHQHAQLAQQKNKRLVFYEGGQHFTPDPFGTIQAYCQALVDCQVLPGMYDLYQQLFDTLQSLSQDTLLFMNFSFISPRNCQYGSWGLLEDQFNQNPPYLNAAPKYQAILDRINACTSSLNLSLSGKVFYANQDSTPLEGVHIRLLFNGILIDSCISSSTGSWAFNDLAPGNYTFQVSNPAAAGGFNALDALLISKYFTGLINLSNISLKAADVNASNYINTTDALLCMQRFVSLINSFAASDWVSLTQSIPLGSSSVTNIKISMLCTGDVNGSF